MLIEAASAADHDIAIRLFNSDGSEAEISGNGTRCAAAFLIAHGPQKDEVRVRTGAGIKRLRLLERADLRFVFEMNMGRPEFTAERFQLPLGAGARDVTLVWVGNPQCAMPVADFDFDWRRSSVTRSFPSAPMSRFCGRATHIPWRCVSGSAARARP